MLSIRLARIGKKKKPFYRVVVIEKSRPRNGRTLEVVGTCDPLQETRAGETGSGAGEKYWLERGAATSERYGSEFLQGPKRSRRSNCIALFLE